MLSYDQKPHFFGSASAKSIASPALMPMDHPLIQQHKHIWIITGPAGSGKSTIAKYLADRLKLPYVEGDEFHPQANIEKMAAGVPLTDADRWDWLIALRQQSVAALDTGASGVVLTCSALKKKYRDVIRVASYDDHEVRVHFVYLKADEETLLARVRARQGHYMKDSMVRSQFQCLEPPNEKEIDKDVLCIDVSGNMAEVQRLTLAVVTEAILADSRESTPT